MSLGARVSLIVKESRSPFEKGEKKMVAVHMCDCCAYEGIIPGAATYPFRT